MMNKADKAAYMVEYRKRNKDKLKQYEIDYRRKNIEKSRARYIKYNVAHRDERIAFRKRCHLEFHEQWIDILKSIGMAHCSRCEYSHCFAALDYHHIDPKSKEVNIGHLLWERPTDKRMSEVKKSICLCSNCHREVHAGVWRIEDDNTEKRS